MIRPKNLQAIVLQLALKQGNIMSRLFSLSDFKEEGYLKILSFVYEGFLSVVSLMGHYDLCIVSLVGYFSI